MWCFTAKRLDHGVEPGEVRLPAVQATGMHGEGALSSDVGVLGDLFATPAPSVVQCELPTRLN